MSYGVALVIFCGVGFVYYRQSRLESETQKWVAHTYDVLQKIQNVSGTLTDAENARRGFSLSGNPDFLKSYATARDRGPQAVSDLRSSRSTIRASRDASTNSNRSLIAGLPYSIN